MKKKKKKNVAKFLSVSERCTFAILTDDVDEITSASSGRGSDERPSLHCSFFSLSSSPSSSSSAAAAQPASKTLSSSARRSHVRFAVTMKRANDALVRRTTRVVVTTAAAAACARIKPRSHRNASRATEFGVNADSHQIRGGRPWRSDGRKFSDPYRT